MAIKPRGLSQIRVLHPPDTDVHQFLETGFLKTQWIQLRPNYFHCNVVLSTFIVATLSKRKVRE
jgi:hypothetical protein